MSANGLTDDSQLTWDNTAKSIYIGEPNSSFSGTSLATAFTNPGGVIARTASTAGTVLTGLGVKVYNSGSGVATALGGSFQAQSNTGVSIGLSGNAHGVGSGSTGVIGLYGFADTGSATGTPITRAYLTGVYGTWYPSNNKNDTYPIAADFFGQGGDGTAAGPFPNIAINAAYYAPTNTNWSPTINALFYGEDQGGGATNYASYFVGGASHLGSIAGDKTSPQNGDMWYNSTTGKFRCYQAGTSLDCLSGGSVSTLTGTANQITVSASTGAVTISIPTNPILPGITNVTTLSSVAANSADFGFIRMPATQAIDWRNRVNSGNVALSITAASGNLLDDALTTSVGFSAPFYGSTSTLQATTGLLRGENNVVLVAGRNAVNGANGTLTFNSSNIFAFSHGISAPTAAFSGAVTGATFTGSFSGTLTGDITGNAATATALANNPTNCSAGTFPLGVSANGTAESCTALPTTISGTANQITASAATGAITLSFPTNMTLPGTTTGTFSGALTGNATTVTNGVYTSSGATFGAFAYTFAASSSLAIPVAAGGTVAANGQVMYDTTADNVLFYRGASRIVGIFDNTSTVNGNCVQIIKTSSKVELQDAGTVCGGGGGTAFSSIANGTNTTAAMVVGTGASLAASGSGTIAATTAVALAANPSDCSANTYATTIAASGNLTCASITNASTTAVSTNTASTIVLRDGSGNFAAGTITASLTGNVTGNADTATNGVTAASNFASGGLVKAAGANKTLQSADLSGDVTTSGGVAATLANIPTAVPMAGTIVCANTAAPSSPSSAHVSFFCDSTDLRFHDKNASGTIGTTVVADTGASNNFLTAVSAAGVITKAQPTLANIAAGAAPTGTFDFSGSTLFKTTSSSGFTCAVEGCFGFDNAATKMYHVLVNGVDALLAAKATSVSVSNNDCVKWVVSGTNISVGTAGAGCGAGAITGLTTGYIPKAGSSTTLTANSALDDGVTTASTITSTEAIVAPSFTATASGSGYFQCGAGTLPGVGGTSTIRLACPATATAYELVLPTASATGIVHRANSSNVDTESISLIVAADITSATITGTQIASSVALAGSPTTTTQSAKDNSTKVATTAYVDAATGLTAGTSVTLTAPRQYFVCTGTCTVTVPVPAAGYEFCVMNDDNVATVITMAAIGSSARYEATARTSYGTAGTGTLVSAGAAADKVCLLGRDSTHYLTVSYNGSWTVN